MRGWWGVSGRGLVPLAFAPPPPPPLPPRTLLLALFLAPRPIDVLLRNVHTSDEHKPQPGVSRTVHANLRQLSTYTLSHSARTAPVAHSRSFSSRWRSLQVALSHRWCVVACGGWPRLAYHHGEYARHELHAPYVCCLASHRCLHVHDGGAGHREVSISAEKCSQCDSGVGRWLMTDGEGSRRQNAPCPWMMAATAPRIGTPAHPLARAAHRRCRVTTLKRWSSCRHHLLQRCGPAR